jgi:predicted nucleic acid-binding Zn ribbon protein
VVSPVGVVFKGSGFYVTDNRNGKSSASSTAKAKGETPASTESGTKEASPATGTTASAGAAD